MLPLTEAEFNAYQAARSFGLPTELLSEYPHPDLAPKLTQDPEKQLLELKVRYAALQEGVDPDLASVIAQKESAWNPTARSPTGAPGLMQVTGVAARDVGMDPKLVRNDLDSNILAGVRYLKKRGLDAYPDQNPAVKYGYIQDVERKVAELKNSGPPVPPPDLPSGEEEATPAMSLIPVKKPIWTEEEFNRYQASRNAQEPTSISTKAPMTEEEFNAYQANRGKPYAPSPDASRKLLSELGGLGHYGVEQAGVASGNLLDLANKLMPLNVLLSAAGLKTPATGTPFSDIARNPELEREVMGKHPIAGTVAGMIGQSVPYAMGGIAAGPALATVPGQAAIGGVAGLAGNIERGPLEQLAGTGVGMALGGGMAKLAGAPSTSQEALQMATSRDIAARGPEIFKSVSRDTPITDLMAPEQKAVETVIRALQQAKPIRNEQAALYHQKRVEQAGELANLSATLTGKGALIAKKASLKGPLPKAGYSPIEDQLPPETIDTLYQMINKSPRLLEFEKINAGDGLSKLIGAADTPGQVPTASEIGLLSEVFSPKFIDAALAKRPVLQRISAEAVDALNIPRSLMSTADVSAPFRQGLFLVGSKEFWKSIPSMFRYLGSEKAYQRLLTDIKARPTYLPMREAKLALTDNVGKLLNGEETFMSNLAERIPLYGHVVRGSDRAYSGFLNKLRADTFDSLYTTARSQGVDVTTPKFLSSMGRFINAATGRGNLPAIMAGSAPLLNGLFFSPRLVASRIQLLNPVTYAKLDPFVRKQALGSLAKLGAIGLTVTGLASMAGADIENDPRSSDFGKVKVGKTRYDIWGGFQQYVTLGARVTTSIAERLGVRLPRKVGKGFTQSTPLTIAGRFTRYKLSPVASLIVDSVEGKDSLGNKVTVPSAIKARVLPMMEQDIEEIYKDEGLLPALTKPVPGFIGVGVQHY